MTAAITIHFRKPELTTRCVDSLLADDWSPVLVWDNSADGGASMQVLQTRYATDARVELVFQAYNLGFGRGMNAALAALGQLGYRGAVLLVNNDARVLPGMRIALERELSSGNSSISMLIAPRVLQDGREQGWLHYQPWLALVTHRPLRGSFAYLSGCCLLVSRPDNARPLFDESFFMYGEDVELSWRFRRQGGRLVLLEDAWVVHDGSASSGQASEAYERFLVESHWLLVDKLASSPASRQLMRVLRIATLAVRGCIRALRYRSWVPLRALTAASFRPRRFVGQ